MQVQPAQVKEGDQQTLGLMQAPTKPEVKAWGVNQQDEDWKDLKMKLQLQKAAQETSFQAAKDNPGVREFIRPHEMTSLVNNWDRQVDNVAMKIDNIKRESDLLGNRAELSKDELRAIFPIIQRLQWTKWTSIEIFWHCFQRARPTQVIYRNLGKPTKKHRAYLYGSFMYLMMLSCTLMAFFEAPVSEDITANLRATWTLLLELCTMPFQAEILLVAIIADIFARVGRHVGDSLFFCCSMPSSKPPLASMSARREQMRYWHELAEMGKWVCIVGMLLCLCGTVALCSLMPQPRAASVARAFFVSMWLSHLLYPLCEASIMTLILTSARSGGAMDGLLTTFPGIMDFLCVGVRSPEFLSWRVQRIVSEEEMLCQLFEAGEPKKKKITKVAQGPPKSI